MTQALNSSVAQALGWSLFHFLWQGALIAAAAAVALKFAARAQTRYAIACCALLAMPAVFAITLRLSIPQAPTVATRANLPTALPAAIPPLDPVPASRDLSAYLEYAVPLWLAGVFCVLLYRSAAWIWATRLRRRGTCEVPEAWIGRMKLLAQRARVWQPVVVLESCLAEVPVVIGYLRPAILIPAGMLTGLPAAHIEAILLHELAHLRRGDYLVALLQSAIEGLLFYHPAVWWISGVIRAERENCCDDFAIAIQGDPHAYASALATMETRRWRAAEPALAANHSDLLPRIRRILRASDQRAVRDFSLPLIPAAMLLIAAGIAIADQAPPLATLPLKIPTPKVPQLSQPMLIAQAQAPAQAAPEMSAVYRKWLNEEVPYIISDEERKTFKALATDQERERFVEQFWLRRDPTPGTPENEFRDEHYRRIAYANNRFTASIPGWKTDRGRIYIQYGPPDEIEAHPSGGRATATFPFQQWRYRWIEGIGNNVIIEFVDTAGTGEYHMTMDPHQKDALLVVPGPGLPAALALPGRHISVSVLSSGETAVVVPFDFTSEVLVSGRATTRAGVVTASFDENVSARSGEVLAKKLDLPHGVHTITVIVKDLKTGATYSESANVEVK
jgi:GWxTD domain-containing protein